MCYQTLAAALYNLININAEVQKFFNSDLDVGSRFIAGQLDFLFLHFRHLLFMYELKKLVAFWKQPGSMLNDDFRFNVGTGCFYEYDANARTKAVSLFSTVAAYAIT